MKLRRLALGICVAVTIARPASADPRRDAETAFREGRRLIETGHVHEGCKRLEESQRLDPSAGTQLNLAGCYEREGRNALAFATYVAAGKAAVLRKRPDWEKIAKTRADALEAKLPKLVVSVPDASRAPGLRVTRDGEPVDPADFGYPVPVDPGSHVVEAAAPGRRSSRMEIKVAELTATAVIAPLEPDAAADVAKVAPVVPAAAHEPPPPSTPRADAAVEPDDTSSGDTQRTIGLVVGGVGIAGLIFGGVAALVGNGALDDAKSSCASYPHDCTAQGKSQNDTALRWFDVASIAGIAGGALAVGGGLLYLTAPRRRHTGFATVTMTAAGPRLVMGSSW